MTTLLQDLRYGLRMLVKNPGFTGVAVLALALGIGANSAIFSLVYTVLLRPLPFREPDRLVIVWEDASHMGFPRNTPAPANYVDWKAQNQVFEDMAAMFFATFNLTGDGDPEKLTGQMVTPNFFALLGVKPALGRLLVEDDDKPDAPKVVVITHGLWQRRFGADRGLAGKDIVLNGRKFTVVGILPAGFQFAEKENEIWAPSGFTPRDWAMRASHFLRVVARLKPGVTVQQAQAEIQTIARRLEQQYPQSNKNVGAVVIPLREQLVGDLRLALLILLATVAAVLLIACANIANLLLARASGRQREIAIRTALGAGQGRVVRQLLTESVLLAGLGGAAGLLLAVVSLGFLRKLVPAGLFDIADVGLDWRILGFTIAVSVLTGVIFGLAPALQSARFDLNEALKQGGGKLGVGGRNRLRGALVVFEVTAAFVLLIGAGLMIRAFARLRGVDPGFRADHVLTMEVPLPRSKYNDLPKRAAFYQQVLERVRSLPGVQAAAFTTAVPLTWRGGSSGFTVEGRPAPLPGQPRDANHRIVSPDYHRILGIPLREGRYLEESDGLNNVPVAVINEAMARKYWPGENPLGKRFKLGPYSSENPWITIVGVVGDVKQMGLEIPGRPEMYFAYRQAPTPFAAPGQLAIRTAVEPMSLASAVRREIWAVDRDQPIANVQAMEDILDMEVSQRRLQMSLLGIFAALALVLASVGIYGVLSYAVTQRTQEIGLRMALGAERRNVLRMVVGYGMGLAALGVGIGLAVAFALTRVMASLLFGVSPTDPATFGVVSAVLLAVALAACYIPARRATRVDPMEALRYE